MVLVLGLAIGSGAGIVIRHESRQRGNVSGEAGRGQLVFELHQLNRQRCAIRRGIV